MRGGVRRARLRDRCEYPGLPPPSLCTRGLAGANLSAACAVSGGNAASGQAMRALRGAAANGPGPRGHLADGHRNLTRAGVGRMGVSGIGSTTRTAVPARDRRVFSHGRIVLGLTRHELRASVRTPGLWFPPALWFLFPLLGAQAPDAAQVLKDAAGLAVFAGLLAAALVVSLPSRTAGAGAGDVVGGLPAARELAAGRVLAGRVSATVLALLPFPAAALLAAAHGHAPAAPPAIAAVYLATALPAAWLGAAGGLAAGTVLRDLRLAFLAVFLVGAAAIAAFGLQTVLTPFGAFDLQLQTVLSVAGGMGPLGGLLAWHALALSGLAAAVSALAAGTARSRGRAGWLCVCGGSALLLCGFFGYSAALARFAVGPFPASGGLAPSQGWQVEQATVTIDLGWRSTATADLRLQNAGTRPLAAVPLRMPPGLTAAAVRLAGGGTAVPVGPEIRLPAAVAPGGTVDLQVRYGGRWTAFGGRAAYTLIRSAAPGRLILAGLGPAQWLPTPAAAGAPVSDFPLTLHLTGAVPAVTFCNLAPTGPDGWRGSGAAVVAVACFGGGFQGAGSGMAEVWTAGAGRGGAAMAPVLRRVEGALAGCLRVPPVPVGIVALPPAVQFGGFGLSYDLRRYGDPAAVMPSISNVALWNVPSAAWAAASAVWGSGGAGSDGTLRPWLIALLPPAAALRAGLPTPAGGVIGLAAGMAPAQVEGVQTALRHIPPQAGCDLLAALHTLDEEGRLSGATIAEATDLAQVGRG